MASNFNVVLRQYETEKQAASSARSKWESEVKEAVKKGYAPPEMQQAAVEPEEPIRPRIIVTDSTVEQLGILAAGHPKGLLYFRDELAGWFGAFDCYGGVGADRAIWLEAYGGRYYSIDRVKRPQPIRIEHFSVGILGGAQPERLAALLDGVDDGLTARFLWVWPDKIPPHRPTGRADPAFAVEALRRLTSIPLVAEEEGERPFICGLTADALDIFDSWRLRQHHAADLASGLQKSAHGKAPGHTLRLALVLEHLWWASRSRINLAPTAIGHEAIQAAIRLMDDYLQSMAERVFGDAALPEEQLNAATLAQWIVAMKPDVINTRKLLNATKLPGLRKAAELNAAIDELCEAGW